MANSAADFTIKAGDTLPVLTDTLTYSDGTAANLTGATVTFVMRSLTNTTVTTNAAATVTNAATGAIQYSFTAADTATAGLYQACWIVTFAGGTQQTWPTDGYLDIWIEANLTSDTNQYLLSLPDMKDELQIPASDRTNDQKLIRWVMAATPVIELVTGPIVTRTFDEWYDGGNYFIRLRHRPAVALMACSIYLGPVEYPMSIVADPMHGSIYSVMLDPTGDRIVRRGPGGGIIAFPNMPDSVHVVYRAGQPSVPENVRQGALEMLRENWITSQTPGGPRTGSEAMMGHDEQVDGHPVGVLMSDRVREWLQPNRRHPSVF